MKKRVSKALSPEQLAYIIEHYHNTPNEEIIKTLGISMHTLCYRRWRHGLKKDLDFLHESRSRYAVEHDVWKRLNVAETHAKGIATRNKIYEEEKARIRWGLPQLTKRKFKKEPRKKRMQRQYLLDLGYIIDEPNLVAYYTPQTKRAVRLEKVKRGDVKGTIRPFYDFKPYSL